MQSYRSLLEQLLIELQSNGGIRADVDPCKTANIAFDLLIGAAQNLLMVPMDEREAYAETLLSLVDRLRPEDTTRL